MADPVTTTMIVVSMASRAAQAMGEYQQAKGDQRVAQANAATARNNAAQIGREASAAEEARRRQIRKEMGDAFTAYAQSGAGADQGMLKQAGAEAELDALSIRYDGQTARRGALEEAVQQDYQAKLARSRARGAVISGILGTASAGLSARAQGQQLQAQRRQTEWDMEGARRRGPSTSAPAPTRPKGSAPVNPMTRNRSAMTGKGY